jgi:hypothetical protein
MSLVTQKLSSTFMAKAAVALTNKNVRTVVVHEFLL